LGKGRQAEAFQYGDRVLKLYTLPAHKPLAFHEAATLARVEALGLPTPATHGVQRFDERWGVLMDLAPGASFGDQMRAEPARAGEFLAELARLHVLIHSRSGDGLRSLRAKLAANIGRAQSLGPARRDHLLASLAALPDGDRLCHGDFHPLNVIGTPGAAMIVDWLDATAGPPAADVCRSWLLLRLAAPDLAEPYLEAYARARGMPRAQAMQWLPVLAAARLGEGVAGEAETLLAMTDPRH
jgi:aminoglycoside phosphotransferase (APT) family kinase protein